MTAMTDPTSSPAADPIEQGIYAPHFSEDEKRALREMTAEELRFEIALLRVVTARFYCDAKEAADVELRAKLWAGLYGGIAKIIAAARAYAEQTGEPEDEDPLQRALMDFRAELEQGIRLDLVSQE
jgi:hypothetical protein